MSFKDFKDDLLLGFAIVSEGKPTSDLEAKDVSVSRKLEYRDGWLRQAVKSLEDLGYLKASYYMGGGEDNGIRAHITGDGLEKAEEICAERGSDLYDEIEDHKSGTKRPVDPLADLVPASDRFVRLDHNSSAYIDIHRGLETIELSAQQSNSLKSENPYEFQQRLAEIKAGKVLLDAPQADPDLIKRVLIPALKWLSEKIADNLVNRVIGSVIAGLIALLGLT